LRWASVMRNLQPYDSRRCRLEVDDQPRRRFGNCLAHGLEKTRVLAGASPAETTMRWSAPPGGPMSGLPSARA
jgi:hypothetical protein